MAKNPKKITKKMTLPMLPAGNYKRGFYKCKTCGAASFMDFLPYSLSNPLLSLPCGCLMTSHPTNHMESIRRPQAYAIWKKAGRWPIIDLSLEA